MKSYDLIFFDIDDTLLDFTAAEKTAFTKVFTSHQLPGHMQSYRKSYQEISKGLWEQLENGHITLQTLGTERFRQLFKQYDISLDPTSFNEEYLQFLSQQTRLMPGAKETIEAFSSKRLAVITNGFTHVQIERMNKTALASHFEEIIVSEQVGYHKPEKEIFDYAFHLLNIKRTDKVLIVGDSLSSDIQGGMRYGIDTCWYNPKAKENHTSIQPSYELRHLEELQEMIK